MQHHNRWPTEPPLTGYTRSTSEGRRLRPNWPAIISAAAVAAMAAVAGVFLALTDNPARSVDVSPVVVKHPTTQPGPPVPSGGVCR